MSKKELIAKNEETVKDGERKGNPQDGESLKSILKSIQWPKPLSALGMAFCCLIATAVAGGLLSLYGGLIENVFGRII